MQGGWRFCASAGTWAEWASAAAGAPADGKLQGSQAEGEQLVAYFRWDAGDSGWRAGGLPGPRLASSPGPGSDTLHTMLTVTGW